VTFPARPRFYDLATADGIPYWHIATLHATDVLASTIVQTCVHWDDPSERCKYCGIGISLANGNTVPRKTPAQLAECVRAVKAAVDLPIEVQFEPPDDLEVLHEVKAAGADAIGIHIEAFDQAVRERITPGKAKTCVDCYFRTFEKAVEAFGNDQVSSYVIVGLGESAESIIAGCQRLVDCGVYPFVVPLRPIVGTEMEHVPPPDPKVMDRICREVDAMLARSSVVGANAKAGCVRCGACSGLAAHARQRLALGGNPVPVDDARAGA
jgi:biotin synthase-related radical SAM superfamily protein